MREEDPSRETSKSKKLLSEDIEYPNAAEWSDAQIFKHLKDNAMSVQGRTPQGVHFFTARHHSLGTVSVSTKYRLPLLWLNKWLWQSLYLVLNGENGQREWLWESQKMHLLYISRLCRRLVEAAKETITGIKADRKWRCPVVDRVLVRFWDHHFQCEPEFVEQYYKKAGRSGSSADVLQRNWKSWVAVGFNGFRLVADEIASGITASEFTNGLKQSGGSWTWAANTRYSSTRPTLLDLKLLPTISSPRKYTRSIVTEKEKKGKAFQSPQKVAKVEDTGATVPPSANAETISCIPPKVAARQKFQIQRSASSTPLSTHTPSTPAAPPPNPVPHPLNSSYYRTAGSTAAPSAVPAADALNALSNLWILEAMQAQLTVLFGVVETIRTELREAKEDQKRVLSEYAEAQLEIRSLKRALDDAGLASSNSETALSKRRRQDTTAGDEDESNDDVGPSASVGASTGVPSYHPLSHLMEGPFSEIDTEGRDILLHMDTS